MKHTPGPWRVVDGPGLCGISVVSNNFKSWNEPPQHAFWVHSTIYNDKGIMNAKANARLIAAAPEMLEIVKAYRNFLRTMAHTEGEVRTFEHVESIIAKAEGKT